MKLTPDFSRVYFPRGRSSAKEKPPPSQERAREVLESLGYSGSDFDLGQFRKGLGVEREHDEITHGDLQKVGKIVLDHLREDSHYYSDLEKVMN